MSALPIYELLAPGDSVEFVMNFMEQVESVDAFGDFVLGETATRTLTREFAWSTDGITYTAYAPLTNPNLNALVLDPDARLYFKVKYTRGGADATGLIQIYRFVFDVTRDPQAMRGHGCIVEDRIEEELPQLVKAMLEQYVYQVNGSNHFDVEIRNPQENHVTHKPIITIYNVDTSEINARNVKNYQNKVFFNVHLTKVREKTDGFERMVGIVRTMFQNFTKLNYPFSITFKDVVFVGVRPGDLGIKSCGVVSMIEGYDQPSKTAFRELIVSVDLEFSKSLESLLLL